MSRHQGYGCQSGESVEALNLFLIPQQIEMQAVLPENDEERQLLALLSHEPRHIADLIRESDLPAHEVAAKLTTMESNAYFWWKQHLQGNTAYPSFPAALVA